LNEIEANMQKVWNKSEKQKRKWKRFKEKKKVRGGASIQPIPKWPTQPS
jgi:hypothetical protein